MRYSLFVEQETGGSKSSLVLDLPPENAATSNVIVFNQKEAGDEEKKVWH